MLLCLILRLQVGRSFAITDGLPFGLRTFVVGFADVCRTVCVRFADVCRLISGRLSAGRCPCCRRAALTGRDSF